MGTIDGLSHTTFCEWGRLNPALYEKVITATNYREAAQALQDAGYATDPSYAQKLSKSLKLITWINMINNYEKEWQDGRAIYPEIMTELRKISLEYLRSLWRQVVLRFLEN